MVKEYRSINAYNTALQSSFNSIINKDLVHIVLFDRLKRTILLVRDNERLILYKNNRLYFSSLLNNFDIMFNEINSILSKYGVNKIIITN